MQLVGNIYIPDGDHHFIKLGDAIEDYQKPQRLTAMAHVRTWDCAVDLGAHVGIFSRHFAEHFDRVVAFEPTLETRLCLEKNVPANVTIVPFAVGDREDIVNFRRHIKNSGASELVMEDRGGRCDLRILFGEDGDARQPRTGARRPRQDRRPGRRTDGAARSR